MSLFVEIDCPADAGEFERNPIERRHSRAISGAVQDILHWISGMVRNVIE